MTALDMTESIAPRSDQMNSDDLMSGPRTFAIREVKATGDPDQPFAFYLDGFPADRPFKPSKSMRRVMVMAWGQDASAYTGRRLTLFRDPEVTFGRDKVGGIRISHMSHIDKRLTVALTVTRGKRASYVVEPLPADAPASPAVSPELLDELVALFIAKGVPEDKWLTGTNKVTGGNATALETITEAEARKVMGFLATRPDAQAGGDQ